MKLMYTMHTKPCHSSPALTKIIGKFGAKTENFAQFSQNENIFVKMGE